MEIEVGSVYRVDHSKLPRSTQLLASLNSTQAVVVKRKSDEDITVTFPSNLSLKRFFTDEIFTGSMQPNFDEKLVISLTPGKKILTQKIPFEEFAAKRGSKDFWVYGKNNDDVEIKWETKPRTRFYYSRKNKVITGGLLLPCENNNVGKVGCCEDDVSKVEEEEILEEKPRILRKRKCHFKGVKYSDKKKGKRVGQKFYDSQHRWTFNRYKLAEENMLKVMKEKGLGPENPMLRPELRAEARRLIGDTGLLDHLLKHMAGKLAPGGKERFCRRHNSDGVMVYWVESADLVDIRKQAGIDDPSWVPPPGWKPGHCPTQDPVCAMELDDIRVEVASMKREVQELACSRGQKKNQTLDVVPTRLEDVQRHNLNGLIDPLKLMYEMLMEKKAHVEKQLLNISKSYAGMEGELERLQLSAPPATVAMSQEAEEQTKRLAGVLEQDKGKTVVAINKQGMQLQAQEPKLQETKAAEKEERRQRLKGAFRICKPQGTFILPSQVASSSSFQSHVVIEDLLGYPTPPSVSSSSDRTPSLILAPSPCYHQHPPRSTVIKPVATKAAVTLTISTANISGSTTIESIASPTTTVCSSAHTFVPDLNDAPFS